MTLRKGFAEQRSARSVPVVERRTVRSVLAIASLAALGYGFRLGMNKDISGVTVAAALGVGVLFLVVALAGSLPSSLKVGDFEIKLDQAWADGATQGAKLAATAATGMSQDQLQVAAEQAVGSIRDADSMMRALKAVRTSAEVVREIAALTPDQLDDSKKKDLLDRLVTL